MARFKTAITNYRSNKGVASFPWSTDIIIYLDEDNFGRGYLKSDQGEFQDPGGGQYQVRYSHTREGGTRVPGWNIAGPAHAFPDAIYVITGLKCAGESVDYADNSSNSTIHIALESGGVYCIDG